MMNLSSSFRYELFNKLWVSSFVKSYFPVDTCFLIPEIQEVKIPPRNVEVGVFGIDFY